MTPLDMFKEEFLRSVTLAGVILLYPVVGRRMWEDLNARIIF